jgi:hypothetical protein
VTTPRLARLAQPLQGAAIVVAAVALSAHAWQAFSGAYLSYVSGIWLALGRDLASGLFYRDLLSDVGYGGTRYFPLFFVIIAGFLKAGLPPIAAGWAASGVAALVLITGLYRIARALGLPRRTAMLFGAAAISPYFVQQTLFEVRADVLAAGLNLWGLAYAMPAWARGDRGAAPMGRASAAFTLALAAKVTSLAVPLSLLAGFGLMRRWRTAVRLAVGLAAGAAVFFAVVHIASDGRALASWRACMFGGTSEGQTMATLLGGEFLSLVRYSRLLTALFVIVIGALVAAAIGGRRPAGDAGRPATVLPVVWEGMGLGGIATLFAGVTAATALTLSSPGTVPSNQMVEWIVVSFAVLAWVIAARPRLARPASLIVTLLVLWASGQDAVRAGQLWDARGERTTPATRQQIVEMVAGAGGPVLAESSLWPVLAGQRAHLLDPFALRVVMLSRPDIFEHLAARIDRREFPLVIFQVDPVGPRGRGYYEHVNFGWPITERLLAAYRFDRRLAKDVFVYVPR